MKNHYIAAYLPVWIVSTSSAASKKSFVEENNNLPFFTDCDDEKALLETLQKIISEHASGTLVERALSGSSRARYSRNYQFGELLSKIESIDWMHSRV